MQSTNIDTDALLVQEFLRPRPDTYARAYTNMYLRANPETAKYPIHKRVDATELTEPQRQKRDYWDVYLRFSTWAREGLTPTPGMLRGLQRIEQWFRGEERDRVRSLSKRPLYVSSAVCKHDNLVLRMLNSYRKGGDFTQTYEYQRGRAERERDEKAATVPLSGALPYKPTAQRYDREVALWQIARQDLRDPKIREDLSQIIGIETDGNENLAALIAARFAQNGSTYVAETLFAERPYQIERVQSDPALMRIVREAEQKRLRRKAA